jgi:hypothetical protein
VEVATGSHLGLDSDHNVLMDRITTDGGDTVIPLATWQSTYGQDTSSLLATEAALFVDPQLPDGDYHLKEGSPAEDAGDPQDAPPQDIDGDPRPAGDGVDIGADERFVAPPCTLPDALVLSDETVIGVEVRAACTEITAGPAFTVGPTGDLTLTTRQRVILVDGFAVAVGGSLRIDIDPQVGAP